MTSKTIWVTNTWKTERPGVYADTSGDQFTCKNGHEGEPKGSDKYTSDQLKDMGMIGLYRIEGDPKFEIISRSPPSIRERRKDNFPLKR